MTTKEEALKSHQQMTSTHAKTTPKDRTRMSIRDAHQLQKKHTKEERPTNTTRKVKKGQGWQIVAYAQKMPIKTKNKRKPNTTKQWCRCSCGRLHRWTNALCSCTAGGLLPDHLIPTLMLLPQVKQVMRTTTKKIPKKMKIQRVVIPLESHETAKTMKAPQPAQTHKPPTTTICTTPQTPKKITTMTLYNEASRVSLDHSLKVFSRQR